MRRDLEQYLGKLGTMIVDASIKFAVNYTSQVFSMGPGANALGWDQKKFENIPAPSIDSETGSLESVLGKQNDLRMKEFETQLKMFFQTYLVNTWEE